MRTNLDAKHRESVTEDVALSLLGSDLPAEYKELGFEVIAGEAAGAEGLPLCRACGARLVVGDADKCLACGAETS